MLKGALWVIGVVGTLVIGYTLIESTTRHTIEKLEKSSVIEKTLLERGYDILDTLPSDSEDENNQFIRQNYWRTNGIFHVSRGLYANTTNGSVPISVVAMEVPETFNASYLAPLFFVVDRSQIVAESDLIAVAGPFLTSAIPLNSLSRRKDSFQRILILGSGIGAVSGFYQNNASRGSILVDAVEARKDVVKTAQSLFGVKNTSRVSYFNEELLKSVDHAFKMGMKYDAIHVDTCKPKDPACPSSRPDKLALILSDRGSLTVNIPREIGDAEGEEAIKKFNSAFKACFQVGMMKPIQVVFCSHENVSSSEHMLTKIRVNAGNFDLKTGWDVTSLITLYE